jgi:murein DD-endopeptidase MepM/ murein hydrolase activator NlpD
MKAAFLWPACLLLIALATSGAAPNVTNESQDGKIVIAAENPNLCPETITLRATLINFACSKKLPLTVELAPGAKEELCSLSVVTLTKKSHWAYEWKSQMGSTKAQHDDSVVYALPYPSGATFDVTQGYNGEFSHEGEFRYAIDWRMPEGSQVCAARDGTVVKIRVDSNEGGPSKKFFKKANVILVQHDDGTIGEYVHLQQDGATVKVGDRVKAGDAIGLSGNTGFTNSPHLHFHVSVPVDGTKFRSIPTKFRNEKGEAVTLKRGKSYTAP